MADFNDGWVDAPATAKQTQPASAQVHNDGWVDAPAAQSTAAQVGVQDPVTKQWSDTGDMSNAEKLNNPYFGIDSAAKLKEEMAKSQEVPKWGQDHPNLYGLYGASKGVAAAGVEGAGMALGAAGGEGLGPVGAIGGAGLGLAAAKRLNSAIGLSDEPADNSLTGISKDVGMGAALGTIPAAAGLAGKAVRMVPGGDTAMNLLSAPIGKGMMDAARIGNVGEANAAIDYGFNKAVRPGIAGNRSASQSADYLDNARNAVKEIVLNKDNLGLTNAEGEPVDTLPQNLQQFRTAIDSTKKSIWDRVQAINSSAGGTGASVPLGSVHSELHSLLADPVYQTMSPETLTYAKGVAGRLSKQGSFSVDDAQRAISMANQSQQNFYANPNVDTTTRAFVDSLVANHLRTNLDATLEAATGTPAAAPLRKAYGSLKAIEKDVNQRAVVDARKNTRGLVDFSDIYTAGELVTAMATMNPVGAAKVGTMATVKALIKNANDPNTHVKRIFNVADKLVSKTDFPLPKVAPVAPAQVQQPPWAGMVNTGGIVQPGPMINKMGQVNTGGMGTAEQSLTSPPSYRSGPPAQNMLGVNSSNLNKLNTDRSINPADPYAVMLGKRPRGR